MLELMITAPASGSGKTILTCALLAALKKRGRTPCAFKCGPDYIDPMFHRSVLGVESHNLDLFLAGEDDVRRLYAKYSGGHGAAVTEGAMGFYDGLGGTTDRASAWHVSDTLGLPVLLALRPKGASLTLAAQVGGLQSFRRESHIAGLFLNDCSTMLAKSLVPMLERACRCWDGCLIWRRRCWRAAIWGCTPPGKSRTCPPESTAQRMC